jgi:hypothetical protein
VSARPFESGDFLGGKEPMGGFRHVCGFRGYDPMIDPPCPACTAPAVERLTVEHDRALVALEQARWHLDHAVRLLLAPTFAASQVLGDTDGSALQSSMDALRHTKEMMARFTAHQKETAA